MIDYLWWGYCALVVTMDVIIIATYTVELFLIQRGDDGTTKVKWGLLNFKDSPLDGLPYRESVLFLWSGIVVYLLCIYSLILYQLALVTIGILLYGIYIYLGSKGRLSGIVPAILNLIMCSISLYR